MLEEVDGDDAANFARRMHASFLLFLSWSYMVRLFV